MLVIKKYGFDTFVVKCSLLLLCINQLQKPKIKLVFQPGFLFIPYSLILSLYCTKVQLSFNDYRQRYPVEKAETLSRIEGRYLCQEAFSITNERPTRDKIIGIGSTIFVKKILLGQKPIPDDNFKKYRHIPSISIRLKVL